MDALRASGIAQKPVQTRVDKLQSPPGAWLPNWTAPFTSAAPVFAGMLLATMLLARFLASTALFSRTPLGLVPGVARFAVCLAGIVLAVSGCYVFVAKSAEALDPFSAPPDGSNDLQPTVGDVAGWLLFWLFIAVVGAGLFAQFLTSRLRVSVTIRDKTGKTDDAAIDKAVAYMTELGALPPRGLQVPRATDVTALSGDVLVDTPTNKILAALKKIVQSALLFVPWNVCIDETGDDQTTVVVARNGWVNRAATFTTKSLGLPDPDTDPRKGDPSSPAVSPPGDRRQKVAAAVVISTLATKHRGFEGLCGATHWRSIGLHYIATTELDRHPTQAVTLLAQALNDDPLNLPAQLASQYYRYKKSRTEPDLLAFTNWLNARIKDLPDKNGRLLKGYEGIYRRLLLNYVLAMLNLHSVRKSVHNELTEAEKNETLRIAQLLTERLTKRVPPADVMGQAMRDVANIAERAIKDIKWPPTAAINQKEQAPAATATKLGDAPRTQDKKTADYGRKPEKDWTKAENIPLAPSVAYNLACYLASRTSPAVKPSPAEQPLKVACEDDRLRSWAKEDPVLAEFHGEKWFQKLVGASPRQAFLEIAPFNDFKAKLEAIGATTPTRLLAVAPWRLREYLDIPSPRADRIRRLATLAQKVDSLTKGPDFKYAKVKGYEMELLELLISAGTEDAADIQNDAEHRRVLTTNLKNRCLIEIRDRELSVWLTALKQ
ncbi:hypothetical protein [Pseudarthrobacter sp. PvP022]|uniref:hypothetical protein n=1 Tax=Pseudarthrobacter sp. PvP022 TaxID=3156433 RepID=UPI00339591F2